MIERRSETLQILPRQAKDGRRGNAELVWVHVRGGNRLGCATTRSTSVSNCPKQSRKQRRSFWLSENACAFVKTGSSLLTANLDACIVRIFGLKTGGSISFPDPLLEI